MIDGVPPVVREKARRVERLLLRIGAGDTLVNAGAELGLDITQGDVVRLQRRYEAKGQRWEELVDGRYGHEQKAHSALREWLYERKREDEAPTAGELVPQIEERFGIQLSVGHVNHLLRKVGLTRPPGRPCRCRPVDAPVAAAPEQATANAGLFFR